MATDESHMQNTTTRKEVFVQQKNRKKAYNE